MTSLVCIALVAVVVGLLVVGMLTLDLERLVKVGLRQARRIAVLVVGSTVVLIGVVFIVLPGPPAVVIIPSGLAILATEVVWARRWLCKLRRLTHMARESVGLAGDEDEPSCDPEDESDNKPDEDEDRPGKGKPE